MGWADIKDRIVEPIMTDEAMDLMSVIYLSGNKIETKKITTSSYVKPEKGDMTQEELDIYLEDLKVRLIKYYANYLLKAKVSKNEELVNKVKKYNEEDLIKIMNMSSYDLLNYTKEDSLTNLLKKLRSLFDFVEALANGGSLVASYNGKDKEKIGFNDTKRIYLNCDNLNKKKFLFIEEYIKGCIDAGIPFRMKPFGPESAEIDNLVLYSNSEFFDKHIDIIEGIIRNNPEIMTAFGDPIISSGNVVSSDGRKYYGVTSGLISLKNKKELIPLIKEYKDKNLPNKALAGILNLKTHNQYSEQIMNTAALVALINYIKKKISKDKISELISKKYSLDDLKNILLIRKGKIPKFMNLEEELSKSEEAKGEFLSWIEKDSFEDGVLKIKKDDIKNLSFVGSDKLFALTIQLFLNYLKETYGESFIRDFKEDFKKEVKVVNSLLKFDDEKHTDVPIYMDELFYEQSKTLDINDEKVEDLNAEIKEEVKEILLYVKGYSDFIYKNWLSCSILKEYKDLPKEVVDIFVKVARNGTDSLTEIDIKNITEMDVKYKLLKVVKAYVEKRPAKKEEFHNTVAKIFESDKKEKKEISAKTLQMYARLRLIEKYRTHGIGIILFNKLPEEKMAVVNRLIAIKDPSELEKELNKLDSSNITYDIWAMSQTIISKIGDKAKEDYDSLRGATSRKM